MGQKVNPISNRLGIIRGWDSNWYGGNNYGDSLLEDSKIRKYLNARLAKASVSRIVIERTLKLVTITVCTARPGIIIGKGGQEVDKLKEELKKVTDKDIQINIFEVKRPELDAVIVANNIARQVEGKIAYRRAIKMAIANTMRMGADRHMPVCKKLPLPFYILRSLPCLPLLQHPVSRLCHDRAMRSSDRYMLFHWSCLF